MNTGDNGKRDVSLPREKKFRFNKDYLGGKGYEFFY
jgi:hypothetical protein